jgi:acetyl-CoA carboxylase biotin carboxylase subunit
MRIVRKMEEFPAAFAGAQSEAKTAFADGRVYLETYLEEPRHIEFQIVADRKGNTIHLGERECTIQRRHQKVVEESPSVFLDEPLRRLMGETAVRAAKACGYENAGTIEFLVDANRKFYFLEMNTRLQVEHPVTELRTGIDLVALQIRIAQGEPLPWTQDQIQQSGHAIECRICAEDPANNFLPSTGRIVHLRPAGGVGVRDDRGIDAGGEISVYYDPMIAKLIVRGATREEALRRMDRALGEYEVLGVHTNLAFCRFVINHEQFRAGTFNTHFVAEHFRPEFVMPATGEAARAAAFVCAWLEHARSRHPGNGSAMQATRETARGTWRDERHRFMRGDES